jgi:Fur family transcriptional regulator, peroxide stress response regulator
VRAVKTAGESVPSAIVTAVRTVSAKTRTEQMVEALASRGHRLTPQRLAILEVLARSEDHPTANQILSRVQRRFPMIGKATVYNTIQLLKDLDQVLELEFRDAANRYDGNIPEPHPHLVCTRCGRIDEVMDPSLHDTASRVADEVGYELQSHRFDVHGLCPSCKRKVDRTEVRET